MTGTPLRSGTAGCALDIHREREVLANLQHKHVVPLLEVIDDPDHQRLYMVFELLAGLYFISRSYNHNLFPREWLSFEYLAWRQP